MKSLAFAVALSLAAAPLSALAAGNCKKAGHHTTKCASHVPTPTGIVAKPMTAAELKAKPKKLTKDEARSELDKLKTN
jgi:hypothetical protein